MTACVSAQGTEAPGAACAGELRVPGPAVPSQIGARLCHVPTEGTLVSRSLSGSLRVLSCQMGNLERKWGGRSLWSPGTVPDTW
jgi:hypothetical protein